MYIIYNIRVGGWVTRASLTSDWKLASEFPHEEAKDICHRAKEHDGIVAVPVEKAMLEAIADD